MVKLPAFLFIVASPIKSHRRRLGKSSAYAARFAASNDPTTQAVKVSLTQDVVDVQV